MMTTTLSFSLTSKVSAATCFTSCVGISRATSALFLAPFMQLDPGENTSRRDPDDESGDPTQNRIPNAPVRNSIPPSSPAIGQTPGKQPPRVRGTLDIVFQNISAPKSSQPAAAITPPSAPRSIGSADGDDEDGGARPNLGRGRANEESNPNGSGPLDPNSAEGILYKFVAAMSEGNLTAAGEYVSPKSKGLLETIREGNMAPERVKDVMNACSLEGMQKKPVRANANSSSSKSIKLGNAKGYTLTFVVAKEDEVFKVKDFSFSRPKK
ncbi:MAG: hypothetical protein FJ267_04940 [Planctomycetes bacterium]|nr:hypothetical protein [Planctomycetota bacterium]